MCAVAAAAMVGLPAVCAATNGYFAHGYGTRSRALAGAGTALPQDAIAAAVNPAGMAFAGDRLDLELEVFSPRREYTVRGEPTLAPGAFPLKPGTVESNSEYFPIPTVGWSRRIGENQSVGLTLYANGGMHTDYPSFSNPLCPPGSRGTGTFCAGRTGVDLAQLFIAPSYDQRFFGGRIALGFAPILAYQKFKARGLGTFAPFSRNPDRLSNEGLDHSVGGGFRIGALAEPVPGLPIGASHKSRIWMSRFKDYSGVFAEQGDFDIPESFNLGPD